MHSGAQPRPTNSQENIVIQWFPNWEAMKTQNNFWYNNGVRPTSDGVYTDTMDKPQIWLWILLRPKQKEKYNYALLIVHKEENISLL